MELPGVFLEAMRKELGSEFSDFMASYGSGPWRGLRWNRRKLRKTAAETYCGENGKRISETGDGAPVEWCSRGIGVPAESGEVFNWGRLPLHFAGAYYIQEPSAMLPAELLGVRPGERVLDLCAAPGGKSTQLIDAMEDRGLLVANDISASRGRAVVKNLERFGAGHVLVTAETPKRLTESFGGYFDRILADVPCSGEGMFRREPAMCREWKEKGPDFYRPLQREILAEAVKMLRPGGYLVYSTCTFNRMENEENTEWLLKTFPDFRLVTQQKIWPHRFRGEGQYAALLMMGEREEAAEDNGFRGGVRAKTDRNHGWGNFRTEKYGAVRDFFALTGGVSWQTENWYEREGRLYELPADIREHRGLRFLRTGLLLGECSRGRFEPSQALAMYLTGEQFANTVNFEPEDERVVRYLKGETIEAEGVTSRGGDGWCLVLVAGLPLGWARRKGSTLKNKYAPGWRMQ